MPPRKVKLRMSEREKEVMNLTESRWALLIAILTLITNIGMLIQNRKPRKRKPQKRRARHRKR